MKVLRIISNGVLLVKSKKPVWRAVGDNPKVQIELLNAY